MIIGIPYSDGQDAAVDEYVKFVVNGRAKSGLTTTVLHPKYAYDSAVMAFVNNDRHGEYDIRVIDLENVLTDAPAKDFAELRRRARDTICILKFAKRTNQVGQWLAQCDDVLIVTVDGNLTTRKYEVAVIDAFVKPVIIATGLPPVDLFDYVSIPMPAKPASNGFCVTRSISEYRNRKNASQVRRAERKQTKAREQLLREIREDFKNAGVVSQDSETGTK